MPMKAHSSSSVWPINFWGWQFLLRNGSSFNLPVMWIDMPSKFNSTSGYNTKKLITAMACVMSAAEQPQDNASRKLYQGIMCPVSLHVSGTEE